MEWSKSTRWMVPGTLSTSVEIVMTADVVMMTLARSGLMEHKNDTQGNCWGYLYLRDHASQSYSSFGEDCHCDRVASGSVGGLGIQPFCFLGSTKDTDFQQVSQSFGPVEISASTDKGGNGLCDARSLYFDCKG